MPKATASNVPASRARPYPTAAPLADATNAPAAPTPTATAFKLDLRNGWDGICEASLRAIGKKFACPVAGCADLFTGLATVQKHVLSLAHAEDVAIPLLWVCPRHEQPFVNNGSLYRHTKKDAECKASVERWCTDHGVAYDHYMSVGYRGAAPPTTEEARARKGEGRWETRYQLMTTLGRELETSQPPALEHAVDEDATGVAEEIESGADAIDASLGGFEFSEYETDFVFGVAVERRNDARERLEDALASLDGEYEYAHYDALFF